MSVGGAGGTTPIAGGAGLEQAGAGGSQCSGSLEAVNQALGVTCPTSLCGATAWATVSCSSALGVTKASELFCANLRALTLDIGAGVSKTCIYAATTLLGGESGTVASYADGPLVGATVTDAGNHFCDGTSATISAGQQLPSECADLRPGSLCDDTLSKEAGGAGSPEPVHACFNRFDGICGPCCPATTPDCSDKPDGYPGYSCTPADVASSFCSCACRAGEWKCGC